jgi:uncharacterized protein
MDIPDLRRALLNPAIYPDRPALVRCTETHISLIFLTGCHAYKIKKPVDFGFLDFTTLEKRRYFCEQEIRLNRRLAPKLYLGLIPISVDEGRVSFEGGGDVVEYAVHMVQIPEASLMDKLLERGKVTRAMIEAVSERLVGFYASADTNETIASFARPERIKEDTDENFEQTEKYIGRTLSLQVYNEIRRRTNTFLLDRQGDFLERMAGHRIRDCHGDLRLEHIFWEEEISIFDCIEFNERFRYTDVAADLGFLAMDLDYHRREDLGAHLIDTYVDRSGDHGFLKVLDFYKCYRAYVRGKVESFRLDDPNMAHKEKEGAFQRAQTYFALAFQYALKLS